MHSTTTAPFASVTLPEGFSKLVTPGNYQHAVQFARFVGCCENQPIDGGAPFDWVQNEVVRGTYGSKCCGCGSQGMGYTVSELHWVDPDTNDEAVQALADAFVEESNHSVEDDLVKRLTKEAEDLADTVREFQSRIANAADSEQEAEIMEDMADEVPTYNSGEYPGAYYDVDTDTVTAWDFIPGTTDGQDYKEVTVPVAKA